MAADTATPGQHTGPARRPTDAQNAWVKAVFGADPVSGDTITPPTTLAQADSPPAGPAAGGPLPGPTSPPVSRGPTPTPETVPHAKPRMTEEELHAWRKAHPKAMSAVIGSWMPETIYKKYTHQYMVSQGFILAGKMFMGAGREDEIWLSDKGLGAEVQVAGDMLWPGTTPRPEEPPDDSEQEAEDDVTEARQRVKELRLEKADVIKRLKQVLKMPKGPDFEKAAKEYIDQELTWLEHITEDLERIRALRKAAPTQQEKNDLDKQSQKIWDMYNGFPADDEWEGRYDLPGDPP